MIFIKKILFLIIAFITILLFQSCEGKVKKQELDTVGKIEKKEFDSISPSNDTLIYYRYGCCYVTATYFYYPKGKPKGTILVFNPESYEINSICEFTNFCSYAKEEGYVVISPNFGKSVFATQNYPETTFDSRKFPDIEWITKNMIYDIQKTFNLLLPKQANFILGYGIGARGAILTSIYSDNLFSASAIISGYYDILDDTTNVRLEEAFGPYKDFPDRWKYESVFSKLKDFKTPIYIAHGEGDLIFECEKSKKIVESLKKNNHDIVISHFPKKEEAGYNYWEKEIYNILDFFNQRFVL